MSEQNTMIETCTRKSFRFVGILIYSLHCLFNVPGDYAFSFHKSHELVHCPLFYPELCVKEFVKTVLAIVRKCIQCYVEGAVVSVRGDISFGNKLHHALTLDHEMEITSSIII